MQTKRKKYIFHVRQTEKRLKHRRSAAYIFSFTMGEKCENLLSCMKAQSEFKLESSLIIRRKKVVSLSKGARPIYFLTSENISRKSP